MKPIYYSVSALALTLLVASSSFAADPMMLQDSDGEPVQVEGPVKVEAPVKVEVKVETPAATPAATPVTTTVVTPATTPVITQTPVKIDVPAKVEAPVVVKGEAPVKPEAPKVPLKDLVLQVELNKGQMVKLDSPAASVIVADPTTADVQVVSPKLLFVHGKKIGETSMYVVDGSDNQIYSSVVEVTHNISSLQRAVKRIAPDADVGFKTVDGGMMMDGFASTTAESENIRNIASTFIGDKEKMVNMVTTAGSDQVTLQVKIVEMNHSDVKRFGINMQNAFSINGMSLQLLQGTDIEIDTGGVLNGTITEVDRTGLLDRSGSVSSGLLARSRSGRITSMIDALETQGLANVLAEPSLTTTSGKTAKFLAGGEFPIPVRDGQGSVTVQYKPFGVGLNFTPVVLSKDRISISVAPEVSTINFDNPIEVAGIRNPIILTRKAEATVELGSGQTFALAGLLKHEGNNSVNKFPGLGDVPVLGALFRSQQFQNNRTELVILVTPYIVRPISAKKMQTPMDGYKPPSDAQRLLFGSLYQQQPMNKEEDAPRLNGAGGFIQE